MWSLKKSLLKIGFGWPLPPKENKKQTTLFATFFGTLDSHTHTHTHKPWYTLVQMTNFVKYCWVYTSTPSLHKVLLPDRESNMKSFQIFYTWDVEKSAQLRLSDLPRPDSRGRHEAHPQLLTPVGCFEHLLDNLTLDSLVMTSLSFSWRQCAAVTTNLISKYL